MTLNAIKTNLQAILPLRNLYLQENNFQIRYNAQHERGWSDSYLVTQNGEKIGYGSVSNIDDRNSIFEFFIIPTFRNVAPFLSTMPNTAESQTSRLTGHR